MLDRLEQRINKSHDSGWKWLNPSDPPKNVRKDWHYFVHAWLPILIPVIIVGDLVISIDWVMSVGTSPAVPHFAVYFFSVFLSCVVLCSPPMLIWTCLVILPYIWAWNRRAARLQQEPEPILDASATPSPEGVWPPAPRQIGP